MDVIKVTYEVAVNDPNYGEIRGTVQGVRISWKRLRSKFKLSRNKLSSDALYCKTTSSFGPKFFAVSLNGNHIFYYKNGCWEGYIPAKNVTAHLRNGSIVPMPQPHQYQGSHSDDEDLSHNDTNGDVHFSEDIGKQTRDRCNSSDSGQNLINGALLYYVVHRIAKNKRPFPVIM